MKRQRATATTHAKALPTLGRRLMFLAAAATVLLWCFGAHAEDLATKIDATSDFMKTLDKPKKTEAPAKAETAAPKKVEAKLVAKEKAPEKVKTEKEDKTLKKALKKIKGTVSFIRKNKMAVEYAPGEEILLKVDPSVKLSRAKSFDEIAQGDTVSLSYLEISRVTKESPEPFILSMTVQELAIDKKLKPQGLTS